MNFGSIHNAASGVFAHMENIIMYHFIINPNSSSGKGIRYWQTVKKELEERNIPHSAAITKYSGHATKLAEQICRNNTGIKDIIVLGGDGTINEVINGIDDFSQVLLGYIPAGSSNDLAKSLGIARDPIAALNNILKPKRFKYLDLGEITFMHSKVESRKFACSSGIGYDADVCLRVQKTPWKRRLNRLKAGKFVYISIAVKQLLRANRCNATVIIDGVKKDFYKNVLLISSMIHKFEGGGLAMAPHADPCDGKLSVTLVHGLSRLKSIILLPTLALGGKHINFNGIDAFNCSNIEIQMEDVSTVHTDGEIPALDTHISVRCLPAQIRMII